MKRFATPLIIVFFMLFSFSSLMAQSWTPPAGSPIANHEHPRLFITNNSLPQLRNYINNYEPSDFQSFINACDGAFNDSPASKSHNYLLLDATNYAFLYLIDPGQMSGFTFGHTRSEYADKAWEHAQELFNKDWHDYHTASNFRNESEGGYMAGTMAILYDWLYSYWTLSQKQAIADKILNIYDTRPGDANIGDEVLLSNRILGLTQAGCFAALALYGDDLGPNYTSRMPELLNYLFQTYIERGFRTADHVFEGTTGWSEGPKYLNQSIMNASYFAAAFATATQTNTFYECKLFRDLPWYYYNYINRQPMTDIRTGELTYYATRDNSASLATVSGRRPNDLLIPTIHFLKDAYPNMSRFGKWLISDSPFGIEQSEFDDFPRLFKVYFRYIWGTDDIQPLSPQQAGLPLSKRFGMGMTTFLSSHDADATRIIFYTPKYYFLPHKSRDMASFVIEKFGNLALDAGCSKSDSDLPKTNRTGTPVFMNQVGVFDPNDNSDNNRVYRYSFRLSGSGDIYSDPELQEGGSFHIGNVEAMDLQGAQYDYVNYDYTRSHRDDNRITEAHRELLYIRSDNGGDDEFVLIYDKLEVGDGTIKKRWILRPPFDAPVVDGSWNQVGPNHWESTDGTMLEVENTFQEAHGKMFLKVLEPENIKMIKRGGDPDMWFTDAVGNDLSARGPFQDWGAYWTSKYRIEIEAISNNTQEDFFNVMQLGDANTLNSMASIVKLNTTDFIGAFINENRVAFFNKTDLRKNSIDYSITTTNVVRHFITGLESGTYRIELNGQPLSGIDASVGDGSVLYFEYQGGGQFHIVRDGATGTGNNDDDPLIPTKTELFQNYPNPFNPSTTIHFSLADNDTGMKNVSLKIYDIAGREVKTLIENPLSPGEYSVQWDGTDNQNRQVAGNIYFYRLITNNHSTTRKMLLLK